MFKRFMVLTGAILFCFSLAAGMAEARHRKAPKASDDTKSTSVKKTGTTKHHRRSHRRHHVRHNTKS